MVADRLLGRLTKMTEDCDSIVPPGLTVLNPATIFRASIPGPDSALASPSLLTTATSPKNREFALFFQ